jgi:serine/threonine protein kinase/Flp pilus assembly protein TadD
LPVDRLQPGDHLGPYRIRQLLGEGGMGAVFLAEDERLGRSVALKVLSSGAADDPVARERMFREARAASQIAHANVAAIHDIGESEGRVYITMEYAHGASLSRRLLDGPMPADALARIGAQVARALEAAHAHGVVHRDIKPGNILVDEHGRVKVVDFGLALRVPALVADTSGDTAASEEARLTRTGYAAGTVAYMSPEQARGEIQDGRSDLFSLGIVLYEAATGVAPFSRSSVLATAAAILHDEPEPLRQRRPDLPAGFAEVVHRCLAKEPARRPRSAAAVAAALEHLQAGHSTNAVRESLGPRRRSSTWIVAPLVAVALGAIGWVALPRILGNPIRDPEARRLHEQSESYLGRGTSIENVTAAVDLARRALSREPENAPLRAHLAQALARLQQLDRDPAHTAEIETLAKEALAADDRLGEAWFARAWMQLGRGDAAGALESARRGRRADPQAWEGFVLEGRAQLALKQVDRALQTMRAGTEVAGGHIFARSALAYELARLGKMDEAAAEYGKVLEYQPDHPSAMNNLASIYLYSGRYLEAVPLYRKILAARPDADAASNLGTALYYLGRIPEAIEAYSRAVELAPAVPDHKRNLADAYAASGRWEEARRAYAGALADCDRRERDGQSDRSTRLLRALVLARLDRVEEAAALVDALAADDPSEMYGQYAAAQVHALAGDRERTFAFARRALELGYPPEEFRRDPYFGSLREDREFLDLLMK